MDKCTFGYIEDKFRLTDPEKADYFNNLALNIWKQITDSLLFKKVVEVTPRYYLSPLKTQKRNKQLKLIEDINNELPEPVVKISNSDLVMVNVSPLFGQETSINAENLTKLNLSKPDITKYLNEGLSVKNSILQKIHDEYLTGKPTYVQNVDKDQNLIPGSYRLNYQSDKIKGKKNTKVAATNIVNSVKDKIETDYPGVIVTPNYDTTYITFKVAPGPDLLSQYETPTETLVETPTETLIETPVLKRGELDKNIRTKYFAEGETTTDKEILTKIANSSHPLNQLAKHLIKYTKRVSVKLVPEIIVIDPQTNKEKNSAGLYKQIDLFTEEIQINEFVRFRGMGVEPTIIHEILHSLSAKWLREVNEESELYKEFNKYYKETIQNVGEYIEGKTSEELGRNNFYAVKNLEEFIVALFTDAKFISVLKEIPASEPTKFNNKMEEIFNFLLSLFKINKNNSIYSEAFAVATNIIEDQKKLEDFLQGIDNFENLQDDIDNYYIDDYSEYTTELPEDTFQENIVTGSAKIFSTISELIPNISDEKINEIYNNYVNLISIARPGKEIPKEVFKNLITQYQVFNYKNTYIFGTYDSEKAVFVTRVNSSPSSKELLAEALPNLVNQGIDFISFVPEDVVKKYERSGYTISNNAFNYNFKGEDMLKYTAVSKPIISDKIFGKPLNEVTSKEFEEYNNSLFLGYIPVEVNGALIQKASTDLSNILEIYLNQFGIAVKDINEIKNKLKIDEVGFADILSKIAYVKDKKDLPLIAGEFIAFMMQYNPLVKSIINDLIQTEAFLLPKGFGTKDIEGNWVYNYNKLKKDEYFKYIGQLISEDLQNKLEGNYSKLLVDKIKDLIKQFFTYLTNTEINKINKNVGIISNNILQQNKKLITSSLYKPGAFGKPTKQVSLEEAMQSDKFGESIINVLSNIGFILTGSTSLGEQGTIQRPNENLLHDIDWVSLFSREETKNKFLTKYPEALKIRDIYGEEYITDTWLIVPEGFKISNLVIESNFNIITSYNVVDKNNNIVGTYNLKKQPNSNQKEEIITGVQGKVIDFFTYESYNQKDPLIKNNVRISNWKDIFKAKIEFARYKDIWDYNRFIPYENLPFLTIKPDLIPNSIEEQFNEFESLRNKDAETTEEFDKQILYSLILPNVSKDKFFEIFSQNNPEEFNKYRQKEVKRIINNFAEKFGITIEQINQYQDRYVLANNKTLSYNGVANLANKTIKYLEGDEAALTEEVAHFMVAMLPKTSPEYVNLKNYISRTPEYQLYYESYLEVYNGDVDKTEEEIMGKVVANSLLGVTENVPLSLKSLITSILNYINNFFNPEYRKAFQRSVDNINHLFFTENFDTNFSEANITFDELYSLKFTTSNDEKVFNSSTDEILSNILQNLKNQRQRFIENKQTDLIKSIDTLIDIITEKDSNIDNSDRIINYIQMSLLEIQKVEQSLNNFEKSGILEDLEKKNFNNLTKEQQETQTQEDRANHLQYVAAAITTLQNLNSLITLIEWNFKGFNNTFQSLSDYNKIIDTLPDSNENKIFSEALKLTKATYRDAKLGTIKGVYQDLSQKLLDVTFKTLNTQDQKNFLELTQTNLTPNVKKQEDVNNDMSPLGTVKDLITGEFNISSFKENIMPLTFQKDVYLRSVDNANAVLRQFALMASAKDVHEYNLFQEKLNQLGEFNETWVSAKDEKGKLTFKLLQKYNFKVFRKTLSQKIVKDNLATIINQNVILEEVENKDPKILKSIINKKYNSPNAIKDNITQLYINKKISKSLFLFLNNYINGYETLYTLKLSEQNNLLSNNNQNILQKYKNDYIFQLENNLANLNFNKKSLPYFNNKFAFTENTISASQLASVVQNIIDNKKAALIDKFVVVPKTINGFENPVYTNQMAYVEGLMNYFKNNIGYLQDIEGEIKIDNINFLMLGDEYFFNLSDKKSLAGINFVDNDYINLEKLVQSNNPKEREIATLKLTVIEKIKQDNLKHNMPSNDLGGVLINNSAAFLSNSKEYREFYNRIFRMAFPISLTLAASVNPLASVMVYLTYIGALDTLIYKPFSFLINDTESNLLKRAYNAWKLSLSEFFNRDLREKNIENNAELEKEVAKGYKKIISNLIEYIKNNLNKNRINDNILLLGEYKIPKPFEVERNNRLLLSTDFLSNQKSITQARYNYETNIRWESWIRMTADYNETRAGVTNSNIIDTIKDRYWFNKFFKPTKSLSALRFTLGIISSKLLKGVIQSGIINLTIGQFGVFLHTNPSTFAKSVINMFAHNAEMLYMGTNLNNVVNSFIGNFGNPANPNTRLSFFDALKNMFTGRDTNVAKYNNNLIKHISRNLRKNRGTGFTEFDESESILTREFSLTNTQMLSNIGEKFIEENTIFQYLNSNPIIDENGKPIKNLKKYLKIENGLIVLDRTKLPKNLYLKNTTNLAYKNYYNLDIDSNVNIEKASPKNLGINPLTNVELNEFLNITMSNDISNLMEKAQGVYNIFNKAYWRNTGIGLILFQFKDYILSSLTTTIGSRKIKNNFTSYETGILNSLTKAFDRMAISGYRFIDKDAKFNKDVDQNLLILNNVSKIQFFRELNFLRNRLVSFLTQSEGKINKKLKELANDNEKFRKDTNRKTSSNILLNLPINWYLTNIKDKPIDNVNFKISGEFNLDTNNPNFNKQLNYIKSLIDKKFKTKENFTQADLDMLTKFDIDQNYLNIVQGYLKLKLSLTADVESINKLLNFGVLNLGLILLLGFLKSLEWPEEEEDEEGKKILNLKDWGLATGEYSLASFLLNYVPFDIDDAYGIDYKKFTVEAYKFSPFLSQIKEILGTIDIGYEEEMFENITEEKKEFLLTVLEMNNAEELPLLKPKLIKNEETEEFELIYGSTLLKNKLIGLGINKEILNSFSSFAEDKEKLKERKSKKFIELLSKKAIDNRSYKFGDRDPNKSEEDKEEQQEIQEAYLEDKEALQQAYKQLSEEMKNKNK